MGSETDKKKAADLPNGVNAPVNRNTTMSNFEANGNPQAVNEIPIRSCEMPDGDDHDEMKFKLDLVLRNLMNHHQLSARKLAQISKVPLSTLTGYLKAGRSQIDPEHLIALSQALKVSIDYLLTGIERNDRLAGLPTTKLFSRVVRLTIEEIDTLCNQSEETE